MQPNKKIKTKTKRHSHYALFVFDVLITFK